MTKKLKRIAPLKFGLVVGKWTGGIEFEVE